MIAKPRTLLALSGLAVAFGAGVTAASTGALTALSVARSDSTTGATARAAHAQDAVHNPNAAGTPDPSATPSLPACPTDVKNHGAYVSSVAKGDDTHGKAHGQLVSAAARSDCGKPSPEASDAAESEAPEAPESGAPNQNHPGKDHHPSGDDHPTGRPSWAGNPTD